MLLGTSSPNLPCTQLSNCFVSPQELSYRGHEAALVGSVGRFGWVWWYVSLDQVALNGPDLLADGWAWGCIWEHSAVTGRRGGFGREGLLGFNELGGGWTADRLWDSGCFDQIRWPQPAMVWSGAWVRGQTEARLWWWKHQILSTWPMVSDKGPGLQLCRKEFSQGRKAVEQSIYWEEKKYSLCG